MVFRPLKSDRRFYFVWSTWEPESIDRPISDEAWAAEWTAKIKRLGAPSSFVQIPDRRRIDPHYHEAKKYGPLTREEGLKMVAEHNQIHLRDAEFGNGSDWHVLVEVGQPLELPSADLIKGFFEIAYRWPARIVQPTPSELARYSVAKKREHKRQPAVACA